MRIAHVVNPVKVGPASDLFVAQPITFETMRRSRDLAPDGLEIELYTAQYPEDHDALPTDFERLPDLERSVLDLAAFQRPRKLPILRDILDRLYAATEADYFVYTNVDIAAMPHFYESVSALLERHDALVINRRTISDAYRTIEDIPLMWSELGGRHGGFDCFVFRRDAYPRFELADACIGAKGIGVLAFANLTAFATDFALLREAHLTFHIGNDMQWRSSSLDDYQRFNYAQVNRGARALRTKAGPLDETTAHGRFLLDRYRRARHHYLRESLLLDNAEAALAIRERGRGSSWPLAYFSRLKRRLLA